MRYRVKSGRPVERKDAAELEAVQYALRPRDDGLALAMTFDPGGAASLALMVHAPDIMLGLMQLRGWRRDGQEVRLGLAPEWADRWWNRPLGPNAFVVESDLAPAGATDPDDVTRIVSLTMTAWCMERDLHLQQRPIPDLMTACGPEGHVLASLHPEPLGDAMRAQRPGIIERMAALAQPLRSPTYAHVLIHYIDGMTMSCIAARFWLRRQLSAAIAT